MVRHPFTSSKPDLKYRLCQRHQRRPILEPSSNLDWSSCSNGEIGVTKEAFQTTEDVYSPFPSTIYHVLLFKVNKVHSALQY
ncbi:hypothetical protein WG66_010348 [Moniliophthora roreri]|nr:hypothetical protein WG66_010348 [Moniliophthora roreri]